MGADELVSELTYVSYRVNRDRRPDIAVERWKLVYAPGDVDHMEARYQREKGQDREDEKTESS